MARLTGVTITGADDAVDPEALAELSAKYPFVEWALLVSPKRYATPRYPSGTWQKQLSEYAHRMRLALHLCGQAARDTLGGSMKWLPQVGIGRMQLNGYEPETGAVHHLRRIAHAFVGEVVLQVRSEESLRAAAPEVVDIRGGERGFQVSVLYDVSGGTGVAPGRWPAPPLGIHRIGYAGGIKPSNVEHVLREVRLACVSHGWDFWVDMESGVRDGQDRFSVELAAEVLERALPWVEPRVDE